MKTFAKTCALLLATFCAITVVGGCGPKLPPPGIGELGFGDGREMMRDVLDEALRAYTLRHGGKIEWSGGQSGDVFSLYDTVVVENAVQEDVANKLRAELRTLPARRGWSRTGSGGTGNRHLSLYYEEHGGTFFFDIFLAQKGSDVELYILHKGVK